MNEIERKMVIILRAKSYIFYITRNNANTVRVDSQGREDLV